MIAILDYGLGNLGSILNMFKKIGVDSVITSNHSEIESADRLVLPGVGSFEVGMQRLVESGLIGLLKKRTVIDRIPTLGICLGMQLLTNFSEEGGIEGLGFVDAEVFRFAPSNHLIKVPHMGWGAVKQNRDDPLLTDLPSLPRFYFVHSYYVCCKNSEDVLLTSDYDCEFHSAFRHDNIWGVQFHPEKSHKYGMKLLENFAIYC